MLQQYQMTHQMKTMTSLRLEIWTLSLRTARKISNEELLHNYGCEDCDEVFRDRQELQNHESTHHKELYRCLRCDTVCRSVRSFTNHTKTDHSIIFHCPYPDCNDSFLLKTSLINHEQKHSNFWYTCNLATCAKKFKYRATYLEHINYRHRESKSVPCQYVR